LRSKGEGTIAEEGLGEREGKKGKNLNHGNRRSERKRGESSGKKVDIEGEKSSAKGREGCHCIPSFKGKEKLFLFRGGAFWRGRRTSCSSVGATKNL